MGVRIRSRVGMVPDDFRRQDVPDSIKDWPVVKNGKDKQKNKPKA